MQDLETYRKELEAWEIGRGFGENSPEPEHPENDPALDAILSMFFEATADRQIRDNSGLLAPIPANLLRSFVFFETGENEKSPLFSKVYAAIRTLDVWQVNTLNSQIANSFKKGKKS